MKKVILVIAILTLIPLQVYSQGEIISKDDAYQLFGTVQQYREIPSENLKQLVERSSGVVMFGILNGELYVLDNKRNVIIPGGAIISSSEVFSVFSVEIVNKLLIEGNSPTTFVEKRKDVLTMTNGDHTLEYSVLCPPVCPD